MPRTATARAASLEPDRSPVLLLRELNRATLARQLLLRRARLDLLEAIDRIGGLQAQWHTSPYIALWSRLARFDRADLTSALEQRRVVKASLMRSTLHIVSAREYPFFTVASSDARLANIPAAVRRSGLDPKVVHRLALRYAARTPRSVAELADHLTPKVTLRGSLDLGRQRLVWWVALASGGFVHVPPSGVWGQFGDVRYAAARSWLGSTERPSLEAAAVHTLRRYLGSFGPASLSDAVSWGAGRLPVLREALATLAPELRTFRDEQGRTLYDLTDAPRPPADVAAPIRFLPKWDSVLLAYEPVHRARVLPERWRKAVIAVNGDVTPTVLVDGVVAARWAVATDRSGARLDVEPLGRLAPAQRTAISEEGERLLRFVAPDARPRGVRFARAGTIGRWNQALRP